MRAQDTLTRPKIGLVLSGGAAHGLAHIGVIKYLEEIGLHVDYVTGTSMGAVVGALYSMGFNAAELDSIASNQQWELLMSNQTPLDEVAPVEKRHHQRIPLSFYWENDSFKLPPAFIRGQKLDVNLSNLFIPANRIVNFDDMPIPYRCVAIDIENGEIAVFKDGYLADAVRASMAIPSVFPPKVINERIYVDGGLIRNFPVKEAKEMGADIIIGVYVGGVKMNRDDLSSMFDILEQSAFMAGMLDSELQLGDVDILLTPKVKRMKKFAFNQTDEFIEKGYASAKMEEEQLKKLKILCDSFPAESLRPKLNRQDNIHVDYIQIREGNPTIRKFIANQLDELWVDNFTAKELEHSLALVYGTKNFSKTSYSFINENKLTGLEIVTEPVKSYTLGMSLNRFKFYNAALILNGEIRNKLGNLSNLRGDIRLSENAGVQLNYYKRMTFAPSMVISAFGKYEIYELPFIHENIQDRLYRYRDGEFGIQLSHEWQNKNLVSAGFQFQYDRIKPQVFKSDGIKKYVSRRQVVYLDFSSNTLDRQYYATRGYHFRLFPSLIIHTAVEKESQNVESDFIQSPEDDTYGRLELEWEYYRSMTHQLVFELKGHGRISSGQSFLDHYKIGGPFQSKNYNYGFIGLEESEYIVGDHVAVSMALRFLVNHILYVSPTVNYLYGEDYLHYVYDRPLRYSLFGFGVQLGLDSPIGPISFDIGYTDQTGKINLNLGIGFRHIY